jgi:hypothetical protein
MRGQTRTTSAMALGICSSSERFRILHLLLEAVVYDGATAKLKLAFGRLAASPLPPIPT